MRTLSDNPDVKDGLASIRRTVILDANKSRSIARYGIRDITAAIFCSSASRRLVKIDLLPCSRPIKGTHHFSNPPAYTSGGVGDG